MLFDYGVPRLTRIVVRGWGILFLLVILWELLVPKQEVVREPLPAKSEPAENYWIKMQKEKPRKPNIPSGSYYFDDPPEAWHAADENDDSDDPELYIDKYDGR